MQLDVFSQGCWSAYGWRTVDPKFLLSPEQVVQKLLAGMERNGMQAARISGGEATMYWEHLVAVLEGFCEATRDARMVVPGVTSRRGEQMVIVVETNGSMLLPERLTQLEDLLGRQAKRVIFAVGMKATSAERLADLTGHSPETAQRNFDRMLGALRHLANDSKLDWRAAFIDKYTDPDALAQLSRTLERRKLGATRKINVVPYRSYGNANRYFTPKRFREQFAETPEADDEETVGSLLPASGVMPRPDEVTDEEADMLPVEVPDDDVEPIEEIAEVIGEWELESQAKKIPGTLRPRP